MLPILLFQWANSLSIMLQYSHRLFLIVYNLNQIHVYCLLIQEQDTVLQTTNLQINDHDVEFFYGLSIYKLEVL